MYLKELTKFPHCHISFIRSMRQKRRWHTNMKDFLNDNIIEKHNFIHMEAKGDTCILNFQK